MPVTVEDRGEAALVVVRREEKANSLDVEHMTLLAEAVRRACGEPRARLVALTGSGRYFSAGLDLSMLAHETHTPREIASAAAGMLEAVVECGKPIVSLVNGYAIGLGFELVVASDTAAAVRGARLGLTAARLGLVPPLSPFMGDRVLYRLALSARVITAEEAFRLGIVERLVQSVNDLDGVLAGLADEYTRSTPWALEAIKRARTVFVREALSNGLRAFEESLKRREPWERARRFLESRHNK